jgi:hypothetical protein
MKCIILLLLFVAASAHAEGGAESIFGAFLLLLFLGFLVWVAFSTLIGCLLTRSTLWRTLIISSLAVSPLAYIGFYNYQRDNRVKNLAALNDQLVLKANSYLVEKCHQERHYHSLRPIAREGGILIQVDPGQRLHLPDAPPPETGAARMRDERERYGESNPIETSRTQYEKPVYWINNIDARSVLIASRFSFVEKFDQFPDVGPLKVTARKMWWSELGRSRVPLSGQAELERRLEGMSKIDQHFQNVTSSTAKYVLSVRDISTTEDRRNWVARAQILLTEKESGAVVSEYVGFMANQIPAYSLRLSSDWENSKACPGREQYYQKERTPWDFVGFFFHEVVDYQ